jgi:hypothetical protein
MKRIVLLLACSLIINFTLVLYIFTPSCTRSSTSSRASQSYGKPQSRDDAIRLKSETASDGSHIFDLRELQRIVPGHSREAVANALGRPTRLGRGGMSGLELWIYEKQAVDPISQTVNDFTVRFDQEKAIDVIL